MDSLYNTYLQTYFSILNKEYNSNFLTNNSTLIFEAMGYEIEGMYYMQTIKQFRPIITNFLNQVKLNSYKVVSLPYKNQFWLPINKPNSTNSITFNTFVEIHAIDNFIYKVPNSTKCRQIIDTLYEIQYNKKLLNRYTFQLPQDSAYNVTMLTKNNADTFYKDSIRNLQSYNTILNNPHKNYKNFINNQQFTNFFSQINSVVTTLTTEFEAIVNPILNYLINNIFTVKRKNLGFPKQLNNGELIQLKVCYTGYNPAVTIAIDIEKKSDTLFNIYISDIYPYNYQKDKGQQYIIYKISNNLNSLTDNTIDNTTDNTIDNTTDNTVDNTTDNAIDNTADNTADNTTDNTTNNINNQKIQNLDTIINNLIKTKNKDLAQILNAELINNTICFNCFKKQQIQNNLNLAKAVVNYLDKKIITLINEIETNYDFYKETIKNMLNHYNNQILELNIQAFM